MKFQEVSINHKKHKYTPTLLPKRSTTRSAGYDFTLKETIAIEPHQTVLTFSDVKCQLAYDEVLLLFVRSSLGIKQIIMLANTTGVIDADYYSNADNDGNIGLPLHNYGNEPVTLNKGSRVVQGIVVNYKIAEDDRTTETRNGGFGSTGR